MKRKTRLGETLSPASVNRFLQILGSIFTRAEEAKLITEIQRPKITLLKEGNEQIRYLTLDRADASGVDGARRYRDNDDLRPPGRVTEA